MNFIQRVLCLIAMLFLISCSVNISSNNNGKESTFSSFTSNNSVFSDNSHQSPNFDSVFDTSIATDSDFNITTTDGNFVKTNNIYTITHSGTYVLKGTLDGQIYINVDTNSDENSDVELDLDNTFISYDQNSPIFALSANELKIKALNGSANMIKDNRPLKVADNEEQGEGAIYAKCDLKITGNGTLIVDGNYNNGIHTSDDLEIKNASLKVTATNNALKGNDSIEITSGIIYATSINGDGLKTQNSSISSKGNQKGNIEISGGILNINSAYDGIDAAYDVNIKDDEVLKTSPNISIYTNKYSESNDENITPSTETMYLRTNTQNYRYAVLFYDSDPSNGSWADATFLRSTQAGGGFGGRTTYYYYSLKRPKNAVSLKVYAYDSTQENNSVTSYAAVSNGQTVNNNYDMALLTISNDNITIGWSNYTTNQGGHSGPGFGDQGNVNKSDSSAKGIKANNSVNISGGTTYIKAYDDGIHANYGTILENGEIGVGDLNITGGKTTVYAADDGFHADRYLRISGGTNIVESSYEAFEGNQIYITGGENNVYATNDAINAGNGTNTAKLSALITISGGYTFAAVSLSGDTDCIDSNGNYTQTGGIMIACGPNSNMSAALDTDGNISLSGGSLILFGSSEKNPVCSNGVTKSTITGTYSNQTYTLNYNNGETILTSLLPNQPYRNINSYSVNGTITSVS